MNGKDNIAGYSLTVGTADMVITGSVDQYDPIIGNVTDGAAVNYKIQLFDNGFGSDYETGTGTWNAGIATISRAVVKTSSNGGALVDFPAGQKVVFLVDDYDSIQSMGTKFETSTAKIMTATERTNIAANVALLATRGNTFTLDVGTVAGTVAAGDDPRFGSVDIDDIDPASPLDGTEKMVSLQGGLVKYVTPEQVITDHVSLAQGFDRRAVKIFSQLLHTTPAFSATNGELFGNEPFICHLANSGTVTQGGSAWFLCFGVALLETSTNSAGRAGLTSTLRPTYPVTTADTSLYFGFYGGIVAIPTTAQACYIGLVTTPGAAAPTDGLYFMASNASPNWRAISRRAGVETDTDTGVPIVAVSTLSGALTTMEVILDANEGNTKFYIDGLLVHTQSTATNFPDPAAVFTYAFGAYIHNLGSVTTNILVVDSIAAEYRLGGTISVGYL